MSIKLYDHQKEAIKKMKNGCVLIGGVGSGKSITALAYYFIQEGGQLDPYKPMHFKPKPRDLYIISTAQKRNSLEWHKELIPFLLSTDPKHNKAYGNKVVIDSWNQIGNYADVTDSFFIFDEQRVCGSGSWTKAFLKIAKHNDWILLSATPADVWSDLIPVFIANGFYRNRTEFNNRHVIYSRFAKFPKIDGYRDTGHLLKLQNEIYVDMDFERKTIPHHEDCIVEYNLQEYKDIIRNRWNPWENKPIENAAELCYLLRKVVNSDETRQTRLLEILEQHPKAIIFYNFNYEKDILLSLAYEEGIEIAQYNGQQHDPLPTGDKWVYLVNYAAGNAGWNCITTNCIIFFSQNYSYRVMTQAAGRVDRLNTPFTDLYYYHLRSRSGIDVAIKRALNNKKKFNETRWAKWDKPSA